jgi:hypothetical protein
MGEPIKAASFPSRFYTEAAILTSRWHPTGLLSGIENRHVRDCTAVLLENQRLFGGFYEEDQAFRDMAIKLTAKVFPQLLVNKIGTVQSLLGPAGLVYFLKYKYTAPKKATTQEDLDTLYMMDPNYNPDDLPKIELQVESEDVLAKTRKMKACLGENFDYTSDVDVDKLAQELINELNAEHLTDIYNNCGTVAVLDRAIWNGATQKEKDESLYIKLCEISSVIHRKTLRGGTTFFVMSQKQYDKYGSVIKSYNPSVCKIHVVENWSKGILMGYAGESYLDRGYAYCPYIPLSKTPVLRDPEIFFFHPEHFFEDQ